MPTQELPEALEERAQLVHTRGQLPCFHMGSHESFFTRPRRPPLLPQGLSGLSMSQCLKGSCVAQREAAGPGF